MFYYIYALDSQKEGNFYTSYTKDLIGRFEQHQKGHVASTKERRPLKLIYFEGCINQHDATKREKYLITSWEKRNIKSRLTNYLTG